MSPISIATATEVFDLLRDDLAAVEREFARQSGSPVGVVTDIATYLIAGGGKRIRPMMLLLAAKAVGCEDDFAHPHGCGGGDASYRHARA